MNREHYLMAQISTPRGTRRESFGFLIQTLAREIDTRMKTALKEVGIDVKIFANLMTLMEEDGINQRKLGEKLNFPEYFTSRNVDAMVEAGFAERRPDPASRRSHLIFLTSQGRDKARQLPPIIRKVNDEVLADLADDERAQVMDLLQRVSRTVHPHV